MPKFIPLSIKINAITNNHQGNHLDQVLRTACVILLPNNPNTKRLGIVPNPNPVINKTLPWVVPCPTAAIIAPYTKPQGNNPLAIPAIARHPR